MSLATRSRPTARSLGIHWASVPASRSLVNGGGCRGDRSPSRPDYFHSAVEDLDQGYQVGARQVAGVGFRAALWNGSKESFVDLHAFLPNGFVNSDAYGVWVEDGRVWVAGDAYDSANLTWESVIWEVPEPTSAAGWVFGVAWLTARRKR